MRGKTKRKFRQGLWKITVGGEGGWGGNGQMRGLWGGGGGGR